MAYSVNWGRKTQSNRSNGLQQVEHTIKPGQLSETRSHARNVQRSTLGQYLTT